MSNVILLKNIPTLSKKVSNIRELKAVNILFVVKDWAPQQYWLVKEKI